MEDKKQDQQRPDQLEQQGFEEYTSPSPNEIRPQEYNQPTEPGTVNSADNTLSRNQGTQNDRQSQGIGQGQNQGNEDGGRQQSNGGYNQGQNTGSYEPTADGYSDKSGYGGQRDRGQGTDSNNANLGRGPQSGTQNPHSETAQENYGDNESTNTSNMADDTGETKSPLDPIDRNKSPEDWQQNRQYHQQGMVEDKKEADPVSE